MNKRMRKRCGCLALAGLLALNAVSCSVAWKSDSPLTEAETTAAREETVTPPETEIVSDTETIAETETISASETETAPEEETTSNLETETAFEEDTTAEPENTGEGETETMVGIESEPVTEPETDEPETEPHVHEYGEWTTTEAATCTEDGAKLRWCECGEEETEGIPATGHSMGEWYETKAPTEDAAGENRRDCDNCDHFETEPVAPLAHDHSRWENITLPAVQPTCTAMGLTEGTKCSECGEILVAQKTISATGHSMGEWYETKAPTENEQGQKRRDCDNCDHFETETVAPLAHDHSRWETVTLPAVEPTCTTTGLTEGTKCSECGEILVEQEIVPAAGHSYASTFTPPTATEDGYTEYTCDLCGDTYGETVTPVEFEVTQSNRDKIGYTGAEGEELVIPAVFEDGGTWYRVTSIRQHAFQNCGSLTSVTIPDGVTSISEYVFDGCSSLASVTIPDSVTSIGEAAFSGCDSLTSIAIPDSVASIGGQAFSGCDSLTSIAIPDSVTSIGDYAFRSCSSLTSIVIPDGVTSIGNSMFYHCGSLTSVTIGDSVTSIGRYAFYECSSLTSVIIPDSVTSIGRYAFYECSSLTSFTIPDSVTSIGDRTFDGCSSLTSVTIGDGVTIIEYSAFENCNNLTSVTIPDSMTSIHMSLFESCSSLISVTIPDSVTVISHYAFQGCSRLTDIYYTGTEAEWNAIYKGVDWDRDTPAYTIHYNHQP